MLQNEFIELIEWQKSTPIQLKREPGGHPAHTSSIANIEDRRRLQQKLQMRHQDRRVPEVQTEDAKRRPLSVSAK